jgi:bud site selection protein 31
MVHRIHYERNKYIFDLYYVKEQISKQLYEWLIDEKIADGNLIAKWRKVR